MAVYNVQANGNAPKEATTGDHIVTAGGTYQVMDSSKYSSYTPEQLAQEGVGYNPSSGLYSKKVNDFSSNTMAFNDTDTIGSIRDAANAKASAQLDSNYATDRQNIQRTYNNSVYDQLQLQNQISKDYLSNMSQLYNDTYYNNQKALEGASDRGLISSGLGNAMVTSNLANASSQNAQLRYNRDSDMNKVNAKIAELAANYNVDLDALERKLNSDKAASFSQNEVAYLEQVAQMKIKDVDTFNDFMKTIQMQQYQAQQAMIDREWQSSESQKDRDASIKELSMQLTGGWRKGSYGGYRKYRSYRSYRNYKTGYYKSNYYSSSEPSEAGKRYNEFYNWATTATNDNGLRFGWYLAQLDPDLYNEAMGAVESAAYSGNLDAVNEAIRQMTLADYEAMMQTKDLRNYRTGLHQSQEAMSVGTYFNKAINNAIGSFNSSKNNALDSLKSSGKSASNSLKSSGKSASNSLKSSGKNAAKSFNASNNYVKVVKKKPIKASGKQTVSKKGSVSGLF